MKVGHTGLENFQFKSRVLWSYVFGAIDVSGDRTSSDVGVSVLVSRTEYPLSLLINYLLPSFHGFLECIY